jgi:hypothetical protein
MAFYYGGVMGLVVTALALVITATGYSGAIAIEAMNWDYKDISAEEFLKEAFERAKRLEALRLYNL